MKKPEKQGLYKIWTDGSAFNGHYGVAMGAGYVIYRTDLGQINLDMSDYSAKEVLNTIDLIMKPGSKDSFIAEGSHPVYEPVCGTSTIAEINAVSLALRDLPENSTVIVNADCNDIIKYLRHGRVEGAVGNSKHRKSLNEALAVLFNEVSRHEKVIGVKTNEKEDTRMRDAHNLARRGAETVRIQREQNGPNTIPDTKPPSP